MPVANPLNSHAQHEAEDRGWRAGFLIGFVAGAVWIAGSALAVYAVMHG